MFVAWKLGFTERSFYAPFSFSPHADVDRPSSGNPSRVG